jgi:cell division septation protein DedD
MALGIVVLVLLGLMFGLGVLVGRHRARPAHPGSAGEPSRKSMASSRHGGLSDAGIEQPRPIQEKLTFYRTLKAPLGPLQIPEGPDAAAKPAKPPVGPAKTPEPTERSEARAGAGPREAEREGAGWTVQVGVFSSPRQAAGVRKQLAEGGFDAQIAPTRMDDGQVRYRVRLGAFRSREEAMRTAERVRSDRSLPTYVTTW